MATWNWPRELTSRLISLYRDRPVLYNPNCPDYKNSARRTTAIMEIYEHLRASFPNYKTDPNEIRKKIHGIRTQYLKEVKSRAQNKKCNAKCRPLWCFDQLQFLQNIENYNNNAEDDSGPQLPIPLQECTIKEESIGDSDVYWNATDMSSNDVEDTLESDHNDCTNAYENRTSTLRHSNDYSGNATENSERPGSDHLKTSDGVDLALHDAATSTNNELRELRNYKNEDLPSNKEDDIDCFTRLLAIELKKLRNRRTKRKLKKRIFELVLDAQDEDENSS